MSKMQQKTHTQQSTSVDNKLGAKAFDHMSTSVDNKLEGSTFCTTSAKELPQPNKVKKVSYVKKSEWEIMLESGADFSVDSKDDYDSDDEDENKREAEERKKLWEDSPAGRAAAEQKIRNANFDFDNHPLNEYLTALGFTCETWAEYCKDAGSEEKAIKHIRRLENNDRDVFKGLFVILMLVMLPFVAAYAPLTITLGYSLLSAGLLFTPNKPSQTSIFIKTLEEV